jgi:hypothetical protein
MGNPRREHEDSGALMYVKCAYCGKWMDVKPGQLHWVSHGLCDRCLAREMGKLGPLPENEPGTPSRKPVS